MTTKTNITLLPCPFCGGEAEMDTRQGYLALGTGRLGNRIAVYCRSCNADMGVCFEDVPDIEPEQVANMWNRRAAVEADRKDPVCDATKMVPSDEEAAKFADALGVYYDQDATIAGNHARALLSRYGSGQPAAVRCNHCGWHGADADLVRDVAADEPEDGAADVCPQCKRIGDLQDIGQPAASVEPVVMKEICPECGHQFECFHNPYINQLRASPVAAPVAQEPVARVNDEGFIVETGIPLAPGTKLYTSAPVAAQAQPVQWPTMPPRKGQSPVLFDDGYAEGWAKCMSECQKAVATRAAKEE